MGYGAASIPNPHPRRKRENSLQLFRTYRNLVFRPLATNDRDALRVSCNFVFGDSMSFK